MNRLCRVLWEHKNKIKLHLEFLRLHDKLTSRSFSNTKQCKINEAEENEYILSNPCRYSVVTLHRLPLYT